MQPETKPAAVGKNFSENILFVLLILLAAGITVRVFLRGAYRWQDDLVWQTGAAVLAGFWFGRRREKNSWAFFLAGAGLLGVWSYALAGLFPQLDGWRSPFDPSKMINLPQNLLRCENLLATVSILLEAVYLPVWIARFCAGSKLGGLLRLGLILTLPAVLLPLSLALVVPFHPRISYIGADILRALIWTTAGISAVLILTMLVLAILKVRFGWKRLLISYGILILISCTVWWGIFYGIQLVRRGLMLRRLAAEGRPMTLQAYYDRVKDPKDGMEQLKELIGFLNDPKFDTSDFPLNSSGDWLKKDIPESSPNNYSWPPGDFGLKRSRKEAMIRISESPAGEKFTAGLAGLAKYDHIRFKGNYTDFDSMLKILSDIRRLVRTGTARAAIAHYTGKTELILPRLKAVTPASRLLTRQPWLICKLVHCNLDMIVVSQVVSLGPVGPQYADDYRFFLNWIRGQDYAGWCETEVCAELLTHYEKNMFAVNNRNRLPLFLVRPLLLESVFRELEQSLRREKLLAAHGELEKDDPARPGFQRTVACKKLMETALALKLYRSLHGHYPQSLSELVPELLPELPLNPMTGKEIKYRLDKDRFEISVESEEIKYQIWLRSSPGY